MSQHLEYSQLGVPEKKDVDSLKESPPQSQKHAQGVEHIPHKKRLRKLLCFSMDSFLLDVIELIAASNT